MSYNLLEDLIAKGAVVKARKLEAVFDPKPGQCVEYYKGPAFDWFVPPEGNGGGCRLSVIKGLSKKLKRLKNVSVSVIRENPHGRSLGLGLEARDRVGRIEICHSRGKLSLYLWDLTHTGL